MQFQPGNDYIIYSICELLASYWRVTDELLNQPALHSFNYDVSVASLVRGEGRLRWEKREDLQLFLTKLTL